MARHVLIADNDAEVSELLAEFLRRAGLPVRQASDGLCAQAMLGDPDVAVLVCDLDMPRLCGAELLTWLAGRPHRPPTVVISGFLEADLVSRLQVLPFVRQLMHKPFDLFRFADLVRALWQEPVLAVDLARAEPS